MCISLKYTQTIHEFILEGVKYQYGDSKE